MFEPTDLSEVENNPPIMASSGDDYDELWDVEWFEIPDVPYMVKFKFKEDNYILLVTNLREIYGEKLTSFEANGRFRSLNPHVEMKPCVLMKSIKASCEAFLRRDTDVSSYYQKLFGCSVLSKVITIHLAFKVSEVLFTFDMKPQILPSEYLRTHLIASTIFQTSLLCRASDKKAGNDRIQSLDMCDSSLQQKSKISEKELVKTFITIQRTVQDCILANYSCDNTYRKTLTEIKASPERKEKNISQLSEMSATLVKRKIEGPSNAGNNPSSTADNNPSSEVDNDPPSKPENPLSLKVEKDPSLNAENDSGLSERQSKQKKRKVLKF